MAKLQYAVFRVGDSWRLCADGSVLALFPTRGQAMAGAENLARCALQRECEAEIVVQAPSGELRPADLSA
jgi:septum formation inhibitor MinC